MFNDHSRLDEYSIILHTSSGPDVTIPICIFYTAVLVRLNFTNTNMDFKDLNVKIPFNIILFYILEKKMI